MRNQALLLALIGGVALTAQQAVFRSTTQYVSVDAVVTDRQDRPVTDLTKDDFEIRENGVVQRIADFAFVSVPVGTRSVNVDAAPGPASRFRRAAGADAGARARAVSAHNPAHLQSTGSASCIHLGHWGSPETSLATEIRIDDRVVTQPSLPARTAAAGRRDAAIDELVPLTGLAPGRHVITVIASTRAEQSATRQVAIEVH